MILIELQKMDLYDIKAYLTLIRSQNEPNLDSVLDKILLL